MEGSAGASNGNGAQSQELLQVPISQTLEEVEERRWELMNKLWQVNDNSELIWEVMSGKKTMFLALYNKHIDVYDMFTEFNRLSRIRNYSGSEDIVRYHRFTEIVNKAQGLSRQWEQYKVKLIRAAGIITDFFRNMIIHYRTSRQWLDVVGEAQNWSDLVQAKIPSLEWIERMPDSEVESLTDEWEEMQLEVGISHCVDRLQKLLVEPEMGDLDYM